MYIHFKDRLRSQVAAVKRTPASDCQECKQLTGRFELGLFSLLTSEPASSITYRYSAIAPSRLSKAKCQALIEREDDATLDLIAIWEGKSKVGVRKQET